MPELDAPPLQNFCTLSPTHPLVLEKEASLLQLTAESSSCSLNSTRSFVYLDYCIHFPSDIVSLSCFSCFFLLKLSFNSMHCSSLSFRLIFFFYWSVVDVQCCVNFFYTAKWLSYMFMCMCTKSLQSCPTLCNPMDCSPLGSSVHGIL